MRIHIGATIIENRMEVPQKIKNETALWLSDFTSENISGEIQNTNSKAYMHPYAAALFTIAKIWKQPKFSSVGKWIKKLGTFTQWNTTPP